MGAQIKVHIGSIALGICLAVTGCSESNSAAESSLVDKPDFFTTASDLESAIYNGCVNYKIASSYFNLMVEKQATENEIYYMAAEMEKASEEFQQAIYIDESEGGYQYKRYINYRDLADKIAGTPNGAPNWSFAAEDAHKALLKWCSDWSVQIADKYQGVNSWSPEVSELLDSQRKP
jgi:hypothetical protein